MSAHTRGPWAVGYEALDVMAPNVERGPMKVCDIRGWGYLTGKGHGALGLPKAEAKAIQEANAALIAAAPCLLKALRKAANFIRCNGDGPNDQELYDEVTSTIRRAALSAPSQGGEK